MQNFIQLFVPLSDSLKILWDTTASACVCNYNPGWHFNTEAHGTKMVKCMSCVFNPFCYTHLFIFFTTHQRTFSKRALRAWLFHCYCHEGATQPSRQQSPCLHNPWPPSLSHTRRGFWGSISAEQRQINEKRKLWIVKSDNRADSRSKHSVPSQCLAGRQVLSPAGWRTEQ